MQDEDWSTSPGKSVFGDFFSPCSPQWPPGGRRAQGTGRSLETGSASLARDERRGENQPTTKKKKNYPNSPGNYVKLAAEYAEMHHDHMVGTVHMQVIWYLIRKALACLLWT